MKLSEVFFQLSVGELSQVCASEENTGQIKEHLVPAILGHVSLGLTALYTRFNLKESQLIIDPQEDLLVYTLSSKHSLITGSAPVKYIKDSLDSPFKDDILKVEFVVDNTGCSWALNDEANHLACRTPSPTVLRIPEVLRSKGSDLIVGYRANHPAVSYKQPNGYPFNPEKIDIELPSSHLQALLYFVASRYHNPVGMSNEFHTGNSYYAKYEAECMRLEMENLETDQGGQYDRLYANGWV